MASSRSSRSTSSSTRSHYYTDDDRVSSWVRDISCGGGLPADAAAEGSAATGHDLDWMDTRSRAHDRRVHLWASRRVVHYSPNVALVQDGQAGGQEVVRGAGGLALGKQGGCGGDHGRREGGAAAAEGLHTDRAGGMATFGAGGSGSASSSATRCRSAAT